MRISGAVAITLALLALNVIMISHWIVAKRDFERVIEMCEAHRKLRTRMHHNIKMAMRDAGIVSNAVAFKTMQKGGEWKELN
jgi:hypothetical protein